MRERTCSVCGAKEQEEIPALAWLTGDVNGDGKVNSSDARLALRAAVGLEDLTEAQKAAADVNRDGNVRSSDARKILRVAVGLDTFGL